MVQATGRETIATRSLHQNPIRTALVFETQSVASVYPVTSPETEPHLSLPGMLWLNFKQVIGASGLDGHMTKFGQWRQPGSQYAPKWSKEAFHILWAKE